MFWHHHKVCEFQALSPQAKINGTINLCLQNNFQSFSQHNRRQGTFPYFMHKFVGQPKIEVSSAECMWVIGKSHESPTLICVEKILCWKYNSPQNLKLQHASHNVVFILVVNQALYSWPNSWFQNLPSKWGWKASQYHSFAWDWETNCQLLLQPKPR